MPTRRSATGAAAVLHAPWVALPVGLALLGLRAWPRALGPEVWQEDGVRNLAGVITDGAATLVEPVNGYLLLLPKLITWIAASMSFTHYPAISIALGWAATLAVVLLLACAPLRLRGGVLLAAAALLVPTDAEVFGLPLYTMWWAAVALMAVVFWQPGAGGGRLRAAVIVLASLSSPACLLALPLHWLRALALRTRRGEAALAVLATVCAAMQHAVLTSHVLPFAEGVPALGPHALLATVLAFLGAYLSGTLAPFLAWPAGLAMLGIVLAGSAAGLDYDSRASGAPSLGATRIHGTYGEPGTQACAVRLRLRRGDQVWYRSEPYARHQHIVIEGLEARFASPRPVTRDWTLLDFSNSALPDAFTVAFVDGDGGRDGSAGGGEWSAVALRAR